ncbi:MAG: hypothetical protein ACF8CQ_08505, partial [Rhodopirellula sp. JB044]|uniref:hypothetical protein n=1 Tax=Rhodopirellula sp. JB044 TaxID=3342844 RepID=UPI00370A6181
MPFPVSILSIGRCLLFSVTVACLGNWILPVTAKAEQTRTINMRLTPHWIDEDHFWFERTTPSGETEIVNVDGDSGSLTVAADASSYANSNQASGFRGGKA